MLGLPRTSRKSPSRAGRGTARAGDDDVTDPVQITRILRGIVNARTLLGVTVKGREGRYVSALLDVDPEAGTVAIDRLTVGSGAVPVDSGARLALSAQVDGVLVRCTVEVLSVEDDERGGHYRAAYPAVVRHQQRRQFHRAPVDAKVPAHVVLESSVRRHEGRVLDVSAGGMSVLLDAPESWDEGTRRIGCALVLGDDQTLTCTFELCRTIEHEEGLVVAGKFAAMSPRHQMALGRFVAALDRQQLKKRRQ